MRNLIMSYYKSVRILARIGEYYYLAEKIGSRWGVGRLLDCKVISMEQVPPSPFIQMEYGESLHYSKCIQVASNLTTQEVKKFLHNLKSVLENSQEVKG